MEYASQTSPGPEASRHSGSVSIRATAAPTASAPPTTDAQGGQTRSGPPHLRNSGDRLHCPNQNGRGVALNLDHNVQTVVHTVDKIYVGQTRRAEHDAIPLRPAETSVTRQIVLADICLHLNDSSDPLIGTSASHQ